MEGRGQRQEVKGNTGRQDYKMQQEVQKTNSNLLMVLELMVNGFRNKHRADENLINISVMYQFFDVLWFVSQLSNALPFT